MGRISVNAGAGYGGPMLPEEPHITGLENESELAEEKRSPPVQVDIYLDTDDDRIIRRVVDKFDSLVNFLGYDGPFDSNEIRGSFIRRSWASMKLTLNPAELRNRSFRVERALEAHMLAPNQAVTDAEAARAIVSLFQALANVPNACLKAGSIVIVKYEVNGSAVAFARQLSPKEMRAWERFPEIHRDPSSVFDALAMAVARLDDQQVSGH
ncbi:hypothetical protein SMC26_29995 [Actinomadura fulvescens]